MSERKPISIPAICPVPPLDGSQGYPYVSSQPIIQLKELEVDRESWDEYKRWISKKPKPKPKG